MVTGSLSPQPGPRPPLDMYMTSILLQIPARNSIIADESVSCGELPKARSDVTPDQLSHRPQMRILRFPIPHSHPRSPTLRQDSNAESVTRFVLDESLTFPGLFIQTFLLPNSTSEWGPLGSHAVTALSEGCPVNFHHHNMSCRVWQEAGN